MRQTVGQFVNVLDVTAEDSILTHPMAPGDLGYDRSGRQGCVIGVAFRCYERLDWRHAVNADMDLLLRVRFGDHSMLSPLDRVALKAVQADVGRRFNTLCARFGAARINNAIRGRILSNRARRVLTGGVVRCDAEQVPA